MMNLLLSTLSWKKLWKETWRKCVEFILWKRKMTAGTLLENIFEPAFLYLGLEKKWDLFYWRRGTHQQLLPDYSLQNIKIYKNFSSFLCNFCEKPRIWCERLDEPYAFDSSFGNIVEVFPDLSVRENNLCKSLWVSVVECDCLVPNGKRRGKPSSPISYVVLPSSKRDTMGTMVRKVSPFIFS